MRLPEHVTKVRLQMNSTSSANAAALPTDRPADQPAESKSSIATQSRFQRTEHAASSSTGSGIAIRSHALPHIARTDVGAVLVSKWILPTASMQRAAAEAFLLAWEGAAWADGMVSANLLLGSDERTVLLYGQWRGIADYQPFSATQRTAIAKQVESAVPGIQRSGPTTYRVYRSAARANAPIPGCIVIESVELEAPDSGRQRLWVDTLLTEMEVEPEFPSGRISGHLHLSEDGKTVLNYAEWTDSQSHEDAIAKTGNGGGGSNAKWQLMRNFPGIKSHRFERFSFHASLVPFSPLKTTARDCGE